MQEDTVSQKIIPFLTLFSNMRNEVGFIQWNQTSVLAYIFQIKNIGLFPKK